MISFSSFLIVLLLGVYHVMMVSSSSSSAVQPIQNANIRNAVQLWYTNKQQALDTYGHIETWDISQVTDMSFVFSDLVDFTFTNNLSNWNTYNVLYMNNIFASSSDLKLDGLSKWNTSQVTSMAGMFYSTTNIQVDGISQWDTSQVIDMDRMFTYSTNLILDVSNWDTSKVVDMYAMFHVSSKLTLYGLSNWNTSNVVNMNAMFDSSSDLSSSNDLNFLDLSNWDTSSVSDMFAMFRGASWMDQVLCWKLNPNVNLQSIFCSSQGGFDCNCISNELIIYANLRCNDNLPKCVEKIRTPNNNKNCTTPLCDDELDNDYYYSEHFDIDLYHTPISSGGGKETVVEVQSWTFIIVMFGWVAFSSLVL